MTTTFFRFKKLAKNTIRRSVPKILFQFILSIYRFFFSKIPNYVHKKISGWRFTERQIITIKGSSLKIVVDPKNGSTDTELFLKQERDTDVIALMKKYCTPNSTFIDIGANIGYETLWGAFFVGTEGKVYAFEPIPKLVEQIQESITINNFSQIQIIPRAASNVEGEAVIYFHSEDAGLTSLANTNNSSESITIQTTTIDKAIGDIQNVSMIKIDVEGFEYEALKGAEKLLRNNMSYIVFEFSPHLYEQDYPGKSTELLTFLSLLGYHIYQLDDLTHEIAKDTFQALTTKILQDETIPNFIASPKQF